MHVRNFRFARATLHFARALHSKAHARQLHGQSTFFHVKLRVSIPVDPLLPTERYVRASTECTCGISKSACALHNTAHARRQHKQSTVYNVTIRLSTLPDPLLPIERYVQASAVCMCGISDPHVQHSILHVRSTAKRAQRRSKNKASFLISELKYRLYLTLCCQLKGMCRPQ